MDPRHRPVNGSREPWSSDNRLKSSTGQTVGRTPARGCQKRASCPSTVTPGVTGLSAGMYAKQPVYIE
ncbi:hypothetical protein [Streptomyces luteogriseus]|uniref:hypothetical protein n=1 Tax=Streptomyces luteogriseus TaxID=68233 RepID=UPI0037B6830A